MDIFLKVNGSIIFSGNNLHYYYTFTHMKYNKEKPCVIFNMFF